MSKEYICRNMSFNKECPYDCNSCSGSEPHDKEAIRTLDELCDQYESELLTNNDMTKEEKAREYARSIKTCDAARNIIEKDFKAGWDAHESQLKEQLNEIVFNLKHINLSLLGSNYKSYIKRLDELIQINEERSEE